MKLWFTIFLICIFCAGTYAQTKKVIPRHPNTDKETADQLITKAKIFFKETRFDSVKYCFKIGWPLAEKSGDFETLADYCVTDAAFKFIFSQKTVGFDLIRRASKYISANTSIDITSRYLLTSATYYGSYNNTDSAFYFFQEAENFHRKKHSSFLWSVYLSKANYYMTRKEYNRAEENLLQGLVNAEKDIQRYGEGIVLQVLVNLYQLWNKPEKAVTILKQYDAYRIRMLKANIKNPLEKVVTKIAVSGMEADIPFLKAVKEASLQSQSFIEVIIANTYLADYYIRKKNYEEAIQLLSESEMLAEKINDMHALYLSKMGRYDLLKTVKKYELAIGLADSLLLLRENIMTADNKKQVFELETRYETAKKEKEISILNAKKELNEKEIALLTADKKMASLLLLQGATQRNALHRENILMDSILKKEQAYGELMASENQFKEAKLKKEKELMQSLTRENILQTQRVKREKYNKTIWALGAGLLLLSGVSIFSLYKKQKAKNNIIEKQSAEMEVLMKEIHHRVKNNLQIVSSLLDLQSHYITDVQASEAVKEGKNRVQSMALIHQNLYSEGNIKGIQVKEYIDNLIQALCASYSISNDKVKVTANIDNLNLDVETMIPVGLVINELISNVFKYAFVGKKEGELEIILKEKTDKLHLKVRDNGVGFPAGMDIKTSKSFGLKMIKAFAKKLKAKLDIYNNNGAVVEMEIAKFKVV
jgi:two-component sensor histidine kinase